MPKYTKEFTEKVLNATDIVKIIGKYIPLQKEGEIYVGNSPFAAGNPKTLVVYPDKQVFKDFATEEAGNIFKFVAHKENISFDQAVERLARTVNITISEADIYKDPQMTTKRNLYAVMEAAANFYQNQMKAAGGEVAKDYVKERGLTDETTKQFKLGFAPATGSALYKYLKQQGFTNDIMIQSGLIKVADGQPYDYFRNRLMFPIWNRDNQIIAFTGRTLSPEGKPKYVNSSDSPIFNKSENLYGMNFAKTTKSPFYILVEGQMDTIKLHQAGFDNVVAISGTAFTERHCQQLQTRTFKGREVPMEGLMIATDGDEAGKKAKLKIIKKGQEFLPFGMRVVSWPEQYKDPDEFLQKCGKDAFTACLKGSMYADNYVIKSLLERELGPEQTHEQKMAQVCDEFMRIYTQKQNVRMPAQELDKRMTSIMYDIGDVGHEHSR